MTTDIWTPDKALCTAGEQLRQEKEWLRKKRGLEGTRPSELGIENYRWGFPLHKKFFEGSTPPPVPLDSLENIEWYEEQLYRCVYGYEYKGTRITGDHYWLLNFTPFLVAKKDKNGQATSIFDVNLPYYSLMHDYIFKLIEEAHQLGKGFMWMSARGSGKTYAILSILAKTYHLRPKSHGMVSASHSGHANEAFSKLLLMIDSIGELHPTLSLARLADTKSYIESGQEVNRDGVKYKEGPRSKLQKVIYGDNSGVTRGSRPDIQLMEEIGDWASGKGNLKDCIGASVGSWRVGSVYKTRVFMIGTGGSVSSDQAKDIFLAPDAYNILTVKDFKPKSAFFLPADYLLGGKWENTAVNDNEGSKEFLLEERERTKEDMEIHQRIIQEFPFTIDEVFRKSGSNIFNQNKIAQQWTKLHYELKDKRPEKGFLEWVKTPAGKIKSVKWVSNPEGNVEIIEPPYRGVDGNTIYPDLYVAGVDSIDMGTMDSTSLKNRSSLACLVKKRIVDGQFFKQTSNIYVAKYIGRSGDVRWDYEEVLKLSMFYGAQVNVEYTRIGVVSYFREAKQYHRLMKRPMIALPGAGDGTERIYGVPKNQNLIGTPATTNVIDHQDGKIKEYIEDNYDRIFFLDLLEQLRDYQREDRRKYDLVIAMGLCELADEDLLGIVSKPRGSDTQEFVAFGYYKDPVTGVKKFGPLPQENQEKAKMLGPHALSEPTWIDLSGKPRFDDNFDVLDAEDLENNDEAIREIY